MLVAQSRLRRRQWHPTPLLLLGKSHGRRSLEGCSPWGRWGMDTTERLHFHFSLSCIGEWNGNLLQCSFLENPRDGGVWWAAVYGVAQSRTRLKRLSSSSSRTVAHQAPLSMGFSRQEYWSGLPLTLNKKISGWDIYLTPVKMAIIKKSTNNKCWRGCEEKRTLLHTW